MKKEIPHMLITKFLSGETSETENNQLQIWRAESPENEAIFQRLREMWNITTASTVKLPDKELLWKRIEARILKGKSVKMYSRNLLIRITGVAATIALLIGFSFSWFMSSAGSVPEKEYTVKTPAGQKSEITLPDGTTVWLNAGTVLTYNTNYNIKNRTVKLEGEAFFDVAYNENKKFEVIAGEIKVQVHGTAFDVKAYPGNQYMDVSLLRGYVTIHNAATEKLLANLLPDQKATISKNNLLATIEKCDAEVESIWRMGRLRIAGESIYSMIEKMSRWYGVTIRLTGTVKEDRYWFTVKTESLTEMLHLINKISPINYTINGEEVTIEYK